MIKLLLLSLLIGHTTVCQPIPVPASSGEDASTTSTLPISTQWLYDAVVPSARGTIDSVVRIQCNKTFAVGSGFVLDTGYVITNNHVVSGCAATDIEILSSTAAKIGAVEMTVDENRDLACLKPSSTLRGMFRIEPTRKIMAGIQLSAWGYPFAHPGPAPLLTVGYLSGFAEYPGTQPNQAPIKRLVINGAFNPGNSGGPLVSPEGTIVGVVVAKRLMQLPPGLQSVLKALAENSSGVIFSGTSNGQTIRVTESQLTAMLLEYYQQTSQVFIGEAIPASELTAFLDQKKIAWHHPSPRASSPNGGTSAVPSHHAKR